MGTAQEEWLRGAVTPHSPPLPCLPISVEEEQAATTVVAHSRPRRDHIHKFAKGA